MSALAFMPRFRILLLALLTVALVATGWAHRMPEASGEALAFMAATGATPADFCGEVGSGKHVDPLCQACQVAGGADLPPLVGTAVLQERNVSTGAKLPRGEVLLARVLDLSHAPQGPPVV